MDFCLNKSSMVKKKTTPPPHHARGEERGPSTMKEWVGNSFFIVAFFAPPYLNLFYFWTILKK